MDKQGKIALIVSLLVVAVFLLSFAFAAPKQCNDGLDNDGDTYTDYPADPGCSSANDNNERGTRQCDNGVDNDGDTFTDYPSDPGCANVTDNSELNTAVQCDDNLDNDVDSLVDYPDDTGCANATDNSELPGNRACNDGADNDGDTKTDWPLDPGCANSTDNSELGLAQCDNGVDDGDNDTLADWPSDSGCTSLSDTSEIDGQCDDQANNDGDSMIDKAFDPECSTFASNEWNCTDSDGGIVPNVAGDILGASGGTPYQAFDVCLDSANLTEYYCGYPWTGSQSVLRNCNSPLNGTTQCVSGQCVA